MVKEHGRTLRNTMICWNMDPKPGMPPVALVNWPETEGAADEYDMSEGACMTHIQKSSLLKRKVYAFEIAMKLVVQYGIDPVEVHRTMMGLFEYRDTLADDSMFLHDYLKERFPEEFEERYCR